MREAEHYFKLFYDGKHVYSVVAHTKWEAIEKAWAKFSPTRPLLKREKFKAKVRK